jgi:uncharacterized protein with HEPN domain
VPFLPAYEMRNALAHGYFSVDVNLVWKAVITDVPHLKAQVLNLLDRNSGNIET